MWRQSALPALIAAALLAAGLSVAGCDTKPANPSGSGQVSATAGQQGASDAGSPAQLPAPEALTDVLYKLADMSVPGTRKVSLVEGATVDEAAQIDRFCKALAASGYPPLEFDATGIAWSETVPGNVAAQITVRSQNPVLAGGFSFPMEFRPYEGTWQLSRRTAEMLLALGNSQPPAH
jgi:hypothetical protein